MNKILPFSAAAALFVTFLPGVSVGLNTDNENLSIKIEVLYEKELTDNNGKPYLKRQRLDVAQPEQQIIYKMSVQNSGAASESVYLDIPLPDTITIIPASITSDLRIATEFSADDQHYHPLPDFEAILKPENPGSNKAQISSLRIKFEEIPPGGPYFIEYDAIVR